MTLTCRFFLDGNWQITIITIYFFISDSFCIGGADKLLTFRFSGDVYVIFLQIHGLNSQRKSLPNPDIR